jgi:hypothetical protein
MRPARTLAWSKTHRYLERCNDPEPLSRGPFCRDCTIATPEYDFLEGQAPESRTQNGSVRAESIELPISHLLGSKQSAAISTFIKGQPTATSSITTLHWPDYDQNTEQAEDVSAIRASNAPLLSGESCQFRPGLLRGRALVFRLLKAVSVVPRSRGEVCIVRSRWF